MRIIAFTGPKFSGKDAAAKALLDIHSPEHFRRAPMAEGVKQICRDVFGHTVQQQEDPVLKEKPTEEWPYIEPRWPMMDVANWMRDKYGGDVWARVWERKALAQDFAFKSHVITDYRFPEELDMIRRHDALIIYIARSEAEAKLAEAQKANDAMANNPSESHYRFTRDSADVVIANDGEIYELHNAVQTAVKNKFGHWSTW